MRRNLILGILLSAASVFAAWENALKPSGPATTVELVRDGKALFRLDGVPEPVGAMLAAGLLCATGVDFTAATDRAAGRVLCHPGPAGGDAYSIEFDAAGNLVLTGNLANAAAALLSEDLGVRAYAVETGLEFPAGVPLTQAEIVPRRGDTPFLMRYPYFQELRGAEREPFQRWSRYNRVTEGIKAPENPGWTHNFTSLVPNELLATQPDFFALVDGQRLPGGNDSSSGQLCLTNPELIAHLTARCRELLAGNPAARYLTVSQNDFARWCTCTSCTALFRREGSQAAALLAAVNQIAEALRGDYPALTVVTDAYIESRILPRHLRPASNVAIEMCLSDRIGQTQYLPVAETLDGDQLRQWAQTGNPIFVWDYCVDFSDYLPPCPDYPVLERNIDFFVANGVRGVLMLGNYSSSDTAQKRLRAWILAQKYWNPTWSLSALIRDFNYGYFGAQAGQYLQSYSELLDREWAREGTERQVGKFCFSAEFLPQAEALFAAALAAAETAEYRARVEREAIAIGYLRLLTGGDSGDGLTPEQRLAQWVDLCHRHGITTVGEGNRDLAGLLPKLRYREQENALAAIAPAGSAHLLPATRSFIEHGAELRDDPTALLGMAASSDGANSQWGIHWHLDDFPEIDLSRSYRVQALVRAERKEMTGTAMRTVWWNALTDTRPGVARDIDAAELDSNQYRWIDCGTVKPERNGVYLLFGGSENGAAARLYLQAISLTPE